MAESKWNGEVRPFTVYSPAGEHGFTAWVTAFDYPNGDIGLSFDETVEENNPQEAPLLEFGEAAGVPVSYCSVECMNSAVRTYRVYLRSHDGLSFSETGRCPRENANFCQTGAEDGRIIGYGVPKCNETGTGWADCIRIQESTDGGNNWTTVSEYLKGTAPYLWRVRRLRNGRIILLASLYGTPWGAGQKRMTRNTMLPDETYIGKILTFFAESDDGIRFGQPVYILPGLGAHEFDFAELPDGRLLFVAGDVQGTPVGRQIMTPSPNGYIAGPVLPIREGTPSDPDRDPQGGYVPETFCADAAGRFLYGYRRGKGFSASNDLGANWSRFSLPGIDDVPYQPVMVRKDDRFLIYGHIGGDNAFGEHSMCVRGIEVKPDVSGNMRLPSELTMRRLMAEDRSHYLNAFEAVLTSGGEPVPGKRIVFRARPFWNEDGTVNMMPMEKAPYCFTGLTDSDGMAAVYIEPFDRRPDIHLAYRIDVSFDGDDEVKGCSGPSCDVLALTPHRHVQFPYDAYYAEDQLYLSPDLIRTYPEAAETIMAHRDDPDLLPAGLKERLLKCGALIRRTDGTTAFIRSIHQGTGITAVKIMPTGDEYR